MNASTAAALIEESIAFELAGLAAADDCDKHFWDDYDPEKVRTGTPVATVTVTAPGLGRQSIFSAHLMIKTPDGKYSCVREGHVERVATRTAARRNGLEGYATRLAAKLYDAGIPIEFKHC